MQWVTLSKFSEISGITVEAARALIKKGRWIQTTHWKKAPNGRIFINVKNVDRWIQGV